MKIVVNDCAGHPFQVHLSRELARRGHDVTHLYASFAWTPKGPLSRRASDPPALDIAGIDIGEPFQKYNLWKRWSQVNQYGRLVAKEIERISPDVVLAANNPLEAQQRALCAATRVGSRFVYWLQDVYSRATTALLPKKLGATGHLIARHYVGLEGRLLSKSDAIVMISPDFRQELQRWGLPERKMHVIPNWAPIEEVVQRPKDNRWSRAQGLQDKFVFLYAGTLGLKHNPGLLLRLASALQDRPNCCVVVASEGPKAQWVEAEARKARLDKMIVLGFQSYEDLPDMLGTADVLVTILDKEAGVFSVPSKVLTSLCAGKALLLSVPMENLASRLVISADAGLVTAPDNEEEFIRCAMALMDDPLMRQRLGANARAYAETTFDISRIADSFEAILTEQHASLPQPAVLG
jgi:putative colanic acid biosynthesis glycosyltransferase WcaI